eukprot:1621510-Amphidinium_carterae.1
MQYMPREQDREQQEKQNSKGLLKCAESERARLDPLEIYPKTVASARTNLGEALNPLSFKCSLRRLGHGVSSAGSASFCTHGAISSHNDELVL